MQKKISKLPFNGTKEQEAQLMQVIAEHKHDKSLLMAVMQKAQDIYGYLPIEIQSLIARELGIPMEKVYGVATFYSQFALNPKGEYTISVCLGTACYVKGSDKILEAIEARLGIKSGECTEDGLFSIDACRCVGACGLAPVMLVDEDVYGKVTTAQVPAILDSYRNEGGDK